MSGGAATLNFKLLGDKPQGIFLGENGKTLGTQHERLLRGYIVAKHHFLRLSSLNRNVMPIVTADCFTNQ